MAWRYEPRRVRHQYFAQSQFGPFRINQRCFIRKEHVCGKAFGASKSCFIACPTDDELEPTLALISEKLTKHGVEPIVAVKDRAYGQDIFCTKICGKIIESRFCLVILDDTIVETMNIPNSNVYYEYGLMTSLGKHIIPLQKDGLKLAFNIQSYDTIKYTPKNLATELERAIRDAIKLTDESAEPIEVGDTPERLLLRRLELAGFTLKDNNWMLNSAIEDTLFRGFGNDDEPSYMYLGKIDSDEDIRTYLEDLDVVLARTEKKYSELEIRKNDYEERIEEYKKQIGERIRSYTMPYSVERLKEELPDLLDKLSLLKTIYVAFIVSSQINGKVLIERVHDAVSHYGRYKPVFSESGHIKIGEKDIDLKVPSR